MSKNTTRQTVPSNTSSATATMRNDLPKKLAAEFFGTLWLVLGGCGSAVLAAYFLHPDGKTQLGIGFLGVSLAFGLTVLTGAYAFGPVSGGHFNPAVTLGLVAGKRFAAKDAPGYIISQVLGAIGGAAIIYVIASGQPGWKKGGFAANGFGDSSPGKYGLGAAFVCEVVMTAVFLMVIMGATSKKAAAGFGGLAIGLCLTLIHLISIPVTNTSVNPARSLSQALFAGGEPLKQVWLFWVAPIIGAVIGATIFRSVIGDSSDDT